VYHASVLGVRRWGYRPGRPFVDPEENERHVVVTSIFDVDAKIALSYRDRIGNALDDWESGPEKDTASEVLQLVATDVRWRT
jgi:hypothetical protein